MKSRPWTISSVPVSGRCSGTCTTPRRAQRGELSAEASQGLTQVKTDNDGTGLLLSNDSDNFGSGGRAKRSSTMNLMGNLARGNPSFYEAYGEFAGSSLVCRSAEIPVHEHYHLKCQACNFDSGPTCVLVSRAFELGCATRMCH